jgi:hypothetical protein
MDQKQYLNQHYRAEFMLSYLVIFLSYMCIIIFITHATYRGWYGVVSTKTSGGTDPMEKQ